MKPARRKRVLLVVILFTLNILFAGRIVHFYATRDKPRTLRTLRLDDRTIVRLFSVLDAFVGIEITQTNGDTSIVDTGFTVFDQVRAHRDRFPNQAIIETDTGPWRLKRDERNAWTLKYIGEPKSPNGKFKVSVGWLDQSRKELSITVFRNDKRAPEGEWGGAVLANIRTIIRISSLIDCIRWINNQTFELKGDEITRRWHQQPDGTWIEAK